MQTACGQRFIHDLQSKEECHCNSLQCSGMARRMCRDIGSLACGINYLLCYHSSGAAHSGSAVMKGRAVDSENGSCANNFNSTGSVYTNLSLLRTI